MAKKVDCKFCGKEYSESGIKKHEDSCNENPKNKNEENMNEDLAKKLKEKEEVMLEQDKKISTLTDQVSQLLEAFKSKDEEILKMKETVAEEKPTKRRHLDISPTTLVEVMNMIQTPLPVAYEEGDSKIYFTSAFDIDEIRYEDLKKLKSVKRYRKHFEQMSIKILDDDVVRSLKLDKFYEKYNVDEDTFNEMLEMSAVNMVSRLETLSKSLRLSFLSYFIYGAVQNKAECTDLNRWEAVKKYFKIDAPLDEVVSKNRKVYEQVGKL